MFFSKFRNIRPDQLHRLIYFLYTYTYPTTHIARLGVKCFENLPDTYVNLGRLDLLHAKMYHIGIKFGVPELARTASMAFRSLGTGGFCSQPDWTLAAYTVYTSTPPKDRELRDFVVREMLHARTFNRALFKVEDWMLILHRIPELAVDLATITLSKETYQCSDCKHVQNVLVHPCPHESIHRVDGECFGETLWRQECCECHESDVFDADENEDGDADGDADGNNDHGSDEENGNDEDNGSDTGLGDAEVEDRERRDRDTTSKETSRRKRQQG